MSPALRRLPIAILLLATFAVTARISAEGDVPFLSARINDYAGILSADTVQTLEQMLRLHEDSTTNQVAVLTVPSLDGETIEQYSIRVVDTWKLGRKERDNGVLLLVAPNERKVRIEVGRGLEGDLPDIVCGLIIRREILPRFKEGDFDGGVSAGVHAILGAIAGVYTAEGAQSEDPGWLTSMFAFLIFLLVMGIFTTITILTRGGRSWFHYLFQIPFWIAFPLALLGLTAGVIIFALYLIGVPLAKLLLGRSKKGSLWLDRVNSSSWLSSTSGGSSGWSSSSGGFSGGGGSFSGGGASGSW